MPGYRNELERFIYEKCYDYLFTGINAYLAIHPQCARRANSRVFVPTKAELMDMILEGVPSVWINDDTIKFQAVVSGSIYLEEDQEYYGINSCETNEWLSASCIARIEKGIEDFTVESVSLHSTGMKKNFDGVPTSKNLVPIIQKKDLDLEAEAFLQKYFPEALEKPMKVPIEKIITERMNLQVYNAYRLTENLDILGQICFSDCDVTAFEFLTDEEVTIKAPRGAIFVDICTYMDRNVGAMNNTLAHEAFHWYRHRLYSAVKQMLAGETVTAHRCPLNIAYPDKDAPWTDEQRMEWQANNVAPRILMPLHPFQQKVDELYEAYDYEESPIKPAVLECIANDLSEFFQVSRQSALIRMIETGYPEANMIYNYDSSGAMRSYISESEAFFEYCINSQFRALLDSGDFKYVDGYIVVNDEKFISRKANGKYSLTEYAWKHLQECTLRFDLQTYRPEGAAEFPYEIFHRANQSADRKIPQYNAAKNREVLFVSEDLRKKREAFEKEQQRHKIIFGEKTCWEAVMDLIHARGMSKSHFCEATNLGEEVYRKAEKGVGTPQLRTIIAIACGLDLDIETTEHLLQLAGHAFDNSQESRALRFCVTGFSGHTIEDRNEFLESYGYKPLGTIERG